jgi:hypothetical protein
MIMASKIVESYVWGEFPTATRGVIIDVVKKARPLYPKGWRPFQNKIVDELQKKYGAYGPVEADKSLDRLGVRDSQVEIDICLKNETQDGILIHVSGRSQAKHEKELLEIMSVSIAYPKAHPKQNYKYGALITRMDNDLKGEHRQTSYSYCTGPLLKLAQPTLKKSGIKGLLIVGYSTPSN